MLRIFEGLLGISEFCDFCNLFGENRHNVRHKNVVCLSNWKAFARILNPPNRFSRYLFPAIKDLDDESLV